MDPTGTQPVDDLDSLLGELVDDYLQRLAQGQQPDVKHYAAAHPELASVIWRTFPALQLVGQVDSSSTRSEGIDLATSRQLGDFRLIRELGCGGMGYVYEAEQLSMGRHVALKILPLAAALRQQSLQRFRNEIRAAAALDHPNIVSVYAVGEDRGVHFYAMQLIRGRTLAEVTAELTRLRTGRVPLTGDSISRLMSGADPLRAGGKGGTDEDSSRDNGPTEAATAETAPDVQARLSTLSEGGNDARYFRSAADLAIQAADALQHAHDQGVLHRDIKPGNLMLDEQARLFITDFGLARLESDVGLTMTGDLVGTLRYMSPEQAVGGRAVIDHRSDIYSLGITLYELLTLQPALKGANRQELLRQIAFEEPVRPRQLNPSIPAELATIVCKAIEKNADERYSSAGAMAEDLRAFLEDRPIKARPPTWMQRAGKWSRRNRPLVWSAGVSTALLFVAAVVMLAINNATIRGERRATQEALRREADEHQRAEVNYQISEARRRQVEAAVEQSEKLLYVRGLGLAAAGLRDGDGARAAALLRSNPAFKERPELRGFEWHVLNSIVATPHEVLDRQEQEVASTAMSPTGNYFATGNDVGGVHLWHAATNSRIQTRNVHSGPVSGMAFHPGGGQLASCSEDGTAAVWDLDKGQEAQRLIACHDGESVFAVAYSRDGKYLATGGGDDKARIWNTATWQSQPILSGHSGDIRAVAFAPDDRTVATASNDRTVRLWDVVEQRCLRVLKGHLGMVLCVSFSPDGRYVISGGNDGTIHIWDIQRDDPAAVVRGHHDGVQALAMHPDGKRILAGDRSGQLRMWHIRGKHVVDRYQVADGRIRAAVLTPEGDSWIALTSDGRLLSRDLRLRRTRVLRSGIALGYPFGWAEMLAISPDGTQLYCAHQILRRNSVTDEWALSTTIGRPEAMPARFSPDGSILATGWDRRIQLWDSEDGHLIREFILPQGGCKGLRFAPESQELVVLTIDDSNYVWDWRTGKRLAEFGNSGQDVDQLEFSPDGARFATRSRDGIVRIWNAERRTQVQLNLAAKWVDSFAWLHEGAALGLAISGQPDAVYWLDEGRLGGQISTAVDRGYFNASGLPSQLLSFDGGEIVVRDLDQLDVSADVTDILQGHSDRICSLAVSSDGQQVISSSRDGTVRAWRLTDNRWEWLNRRHRIDEPIRDFAWSDLGGAGIVLTRRFRSDAYRWPQGETQTPVATAAPGVAHHRVAVHQQVVATGDSDGFVRVWGRSEKEPVQEFQASADGHRVDALEFSPGGVFLAGGSVPGNQLKLWRTRDWREVYAIHAENCDDLKFSSDGRQLAYCDGREVVLLDVTTCREVRRFRDHSLMVHGVAFSPDTSWLATASEDRKLRVWQVQTGDLLQTFSGHSASICSVTFSPDGRTLISGDDNGSIKLWHLETGQELYTLDTLDGGVEKLAFDPTGHVLLALSNEGTVRVYDATPGPDTTSGREHQSAARNVTPHTSGKAVFVTLGDLPGGKHYSEAFDASTDGSVVVGIGETEHGPRCFRWTRTEGMVLLDSPAQVWSPRVTADGSTVLARTTDDAGRLRVARWGEPTRSPTFLPETAANKELEFFATDARGENYVGGLRSRIVWRATVATPRSYHVLPHPDGSRDSIALSISPDGRYIIGTAWQGFHSFRNSRNYDMKVVRWRQGEMEILPGFDCEAYNWMPNDVSADGQVVVGARWPVGAPGPWLSHKKVQPFRWEEGKITVLGPPSGEFHWVSPDGQVAAGEDARGAFVWDAGHGLRFMSELLTSYGVPLSDWTLQTCAAFSADGTTFVGRAVAPDGHSEAWRARIPRDAFYNSNKELDPPQPEIAAKTGHNHLNGELINELHCPDISNINKRDLFGFDVAIDGEYAVASAPFLNGGSVYVYQRDRNGTPHAADDKWIFHSRLKAVDTAAGDQFGQSVAIDGDTIVVGAHRDAEGGVASGSAYVFSLHDAQWLQQAKLTASDAAAGDQFGASVGIDRETIVVGAFRDDHAGAVDAGSAYIFTKSPRGWSDAHEDAKLIAADFAARDRFGHAVAIAGETIAVGAYLDDDAGTDSGSVYLFHKPDAGWTSHRAHDCKLTPWDYGVRKRFGVSIAMDGETLLVGAFGDDLNTINKGSAYVFRRSGMNWTLQAKLTSERSQDHNSVGCSVSVSGDTCVIGATGAAYIFQRTVDEWTWRTRLAHSDAIGKDPFGRTVAIDGHTVIVGAPGVTDFGNAGTTYFYQLKMD